MGVEIGSAEIWGEKCASEGDAVFSGFDIGAIYCRKSVDSIGDGVSYTDLWNLAVVWDPNLGRCGLEPDHSSRRLS